MKSLKFQGDILIFVILFRFLNLLQITTLTIHTCTVINNSLSYRGHLKLSSNSHLLLCSHSHNSVPPRTSAERIHGRGTVRRTSVYQ